MTGLHILFDCSGKPLDEDLIARFSGHATGIECSTADMRPQASLWARHVYRQITSAPGTTVTSPGGKAQVLFHGEAYNAPELADRLGLRGANEKSIVDGPDLVARGIEAEGMSFVQRVNGAFFLAAWFPDGQRLCFANDRYGLRAHYYGWDGHTLFVSPRPAAIFECWSRQNRLDPRAVVELFAFQYPMGDRTLVDGVSIVPPACVARVVGPELRCRQYWDFPYPDVPSRASEADLREELKARITTAVERQLPADAPLGVTLSGGIDSRVLAGLASRHIPHLPTFTYGDALAMDRRFAAQVAQTIGSDHFVASPDGVDWPEAYRQCVSAHDGMVPVIHSHAEMVLAALASKVGVVLDGLLGNNLAGDHLDPCLVSNSPPSDMTRWLMENKHHKVFSREEMSAFFVRSDYRDCVRDLQRAMANRVARCISRHPANVSDYVDFRERQRRLSAEAAALLRARVEIRTPLTDYDLMDFALSMPFHLRLRRRLFRDAVRELLPALRHVRLTPTGDRLVHRWRATELRQWLRPTTYYGRLVPQSVKDRLRPMLSKLGLTSQIAPYAGIYRTTIVPAFAECFDPEAGAADSIIRHDGIRPVVADLESKGRLRDVLKLSVWLTFHLFRAKFGLAE